MSDVIETGALPLAGLRVLDLVSGPMAAITRYYAELGADVVRIEPAQGSPDRRSGTMTEGISLDFAAANLGKRAATLDQFDSLAADADIVVAARGIDQSALLDANPALVVASVSDFGNSGRFADWQGSGPVFHALSGELSRSGIPGREPLLPPGTLAVECAAAQAAYVILIAHWRALATGKGDYLDFSTLDGAAQALDPGFGMAGSATAGVPASDLPRGRPEARFMYPILPCQDGFVRICVLTPRQWRSMFEWMGRPEEFADPSFDKIQNRFASKTLLPAIATLFAGKTGRAVEEEGQRFGVPVAAVLDLDKALATEQMRARRAFVPVELKPGLALPFPDGVLEIDGRRMGVAGPLPELPAAVVEWRPRGPVTKPQSEGPRPLEGLRVLDLGVIVVGAETGRLLADQGADVVKVESTAFPDGSRQNRVGGPMSVVFAAGHRNKRSIGINLRDPEGKSLLLDLVRGSDVILSNFKGGTLASLGLDYQSLQAVNPRLIVVDSSAFGPTGPWSRRMGYGPLVRASAGLTTQWRYPGEPESFSDAITVYPDHVAARIGAMAVIAMLKRRLATGRGGQASISQAEVMLSQMAPRIAADAASGAGHAVLGDPVTSALYRCAGDDEWCVVTLRNDSDRQALTRLTKGEALDAWLAAREPRDAMEELQAAGVPAGAMLRVSELPDFDYFVQRRLFRECRHPYMADPFMIETAPVRALHLPDPPERPAPVMAEHTIDLLRQRLDLDSTTIEALLEAGTLEQYKDEGREAV